MSLKRTLQILTSVITIACTAQLPTLGLYLAYDAGKPKAGGAPQ